MTNNKKPVAEQGRLGPQKRAALFFLVLGLVALLGYGGSMIKHRIDYAITDAVFVETDSINNVGFQQVGGKIIRLTKLEGDPVEKGELLAEIDPASRQLAVEELRERLEAQKKQRERLEVALARITREVALREGMARDRLRGLAREREALQETIASLDATIAQLQRDTRRYRELYEQGAVAKRAFESIDTELIARKKERDANSKRLAALGARLLAAQKEVALAVAQRKTIAETRKALEAIGKEIQSLRSRLEDAELNLAYCRLESPINGRVGKKYASLGDVVEAGTPIYALIDPRDIYILVLLEETKLKGVEPGCPARIKIDAYPDLQYRGVVKKILPASAAKFALVPRDISAGEFTKVVQRIQVKVKITRGDVGRLVVGMGGEIEIKRKKG